jgi:hypothetical protein
MTADGAPATGSNRDDPGVPEALPRVIRMVGRRLGPEGIDRIWVFPPLRQGRRESGLVAVSCFETSDEARRLVTASYLAERSGQGLTVAPTLMEEGAAPPDTLPRIIAGVVKRADLSVGDPREVVIEGNEEAFDELMSEFDPALLEEEVVQ